MIADRGVALARCHGDAAQGNSVEDDDVVADLGGLADDDAGRVVDEDAASDTCLRVDVDAGDSAGR